ncbi:MAG: sigma-70 family RNA polymerase sigma factor [Dehalococcoidia bacterium]|nr:sigma-70 family RNA polymerase sigma factor [Dehalococcoidia bacterium]
MDESELVERSRRGDLAAFNDIVAAYQNRVYNLCLRMLGSPPAAEDATQEAFLSAYRSIGRLRGSGVRSWLFRIASNTCIDELRRRRRQPQVSLESPATNDDDDRPLDVADRDAGPEQRALQGELGEALQAELLRLQPDQRLAVILCDVEELSYDEIASAMGCSVGTVKSRISRGRRRLREALRARPELFGELIRHMDRETED